MADLLSSPDPLNDNPPHYSPRKTRRSSNVRRSLPRQSSPTKQTFELDVGSGLSPQKLFVTVEAGPDENHGAHSLVGGSSSPSRAPRRRERTTTTTVPLKGLSDSEEEPQQTTTPKRGRGRPRKSDGSVAPKKGRASTPVRRNSGRRKSIGDIVDGDDVDDVDFQIGKGVQIGRGKGRSRSRSTAAPSRKSTPVSKSIESDATVPNTKPRAGKGRRRSSVVEPVFIREDTETDSNGDDDELEQSEQHNALQDIDGNGTPSGYSTIRSATTIGWGEPDVVARFEPGNETPRQPGWSSPRNVRSSSVTRRSTTLSSRSSSVEEPYADIYDALDQVEDHSEGQDQDQEDYEEDDDVGELQEFDTILESEGFSMISVDSVPSLRGHLSSPFSQQPNVSSNGPGSKLLGHLKAPTALEDSFSSIPGEVLYAATPARQSNSQNLLSAPASRPNDTLSSVPPKDIQAATPSRNHLTRLKSAKGLGEDSFSSVAPEILEAATPGRNLQKKHTPIPKLLQTAAYEDSFSAIPSAVLEAATPATKRASPSQSVILPPDNKSLEPKRTNRSPSQSHNSRLLTPVESPPLGDEGAPKPAVNAQLPLEPPNKDISTDDASVHHSYLPSSPPSIGPRRYTYTAHLRRRSDLQPGITETPSIVFSSPSLPPPINVARAPPSAPADQINRPALSPIARAGQALQNIIVPSSPRNRSLSLGSPFKSPAAERKPTSSAERFNPSPSHERGIKNLPRLDLNGNLSSSSAVRSSVQSMQNDDPFSRSTISQQRSPSPEDKEQYSLGLPMQSRSLFSRPSTVNSQAETSLSENDMSWQAEEEIPMTKTVIGSALVGKSQSTSMGEHPQEACGSSNQHCDDEDFGLLLETINSSSPAVPQPDAQERRHYEKPRRSKIPSPWRQNSKRLTYTDELSHLSSPPVTAKPSLSSAFGRAVSSGQSTSQHTTVNASSDELDGDISSWKIPEKANFNPRPRQTSNHDVSAFFANSPGRPLPTLSQSLRQGPSPSTAAISDSSEDLEGRLGKFTSKKQDPFAPIPQKANFDPRPRGSSATKTSSALGIFAKPPVTRPLTPTETVSSIEGSSVLASSTSQDEDHNRAPTAPHDQSPNTYTDSSELLSSEIPEDEEAAAHVRTRRWTEAVELSPDNVETPGQTVIPSSPTKSCLRSPIKAQGSMTPGKNVQFASSSPLPSPSEERLSPTTWSKKHWQLLDGIWRSHMKLRNCSPGSMLAGQLSTPKDGVEDGKKRRNSTRVISKLLGKKVSTKNSPWEMTLEQWHLEVVDEFRGKCPGWEEVTIALRVFSLVVGAEMRIRDGKPM